MDFRVDLVAFGVVIGLCWLALLPPGGAAMKAGVKEGDRIIKVSKLSLSSILQWWQVQALPSAVACVVLHFSTSSGSHSRARDEDSWLLCFRLFKFIDLEAFWNRFYLSLLHKIQKIRLRRNSCGPQVLTSVWPPHSADMRGSSGCRSPGYIKEILTTETSTPPVRKKPIGPIDTHRYNCKKKYGWRHGSYPWKLRSQFGTDNVNLDEQVSRGNEEALGNGFLKK